MTKSIRIQQQICRLLRLVRKYQHSKPRRAHRYRHKLGECWSRSEPDSEPVYELKKFDTITITADDVIPVSDEYTRFSRELLETMCRNLAIPCCRLTDP